MYKQKRPSEKNTKMEPKRHAAGLFLGAIWEPFPPKMPSKFDAKLYIEKVLTFMRKCVQNDAKTMSKIDDKSMTFRNPRFLVFCEEYNVKIVFLHDQGC